MSMILFCILPLTCCCHYGSDLGTALKSLVCCVCDLSYTPTHSNFNCIHMFCPGKDYLEGEWKGLNHIYLKFSVNQIASSNISSQ